MFGARVLTNSLVLLHLGSLILHLYSRPLKITVVADLNKATLLGTDKNGIQDSSSYLEMFKIWVRVVVGIMIFLGYFLIYIVRYNLSVHIVDMAQIVKRVQFITASVNGNDTELTILLKNSRTGNVIDIMNWNDLKVAQLFAAYHIGYCICFPIFHNFGDRYGPTWMVGISGMTSGILNCLSPASAYYDFYALFVVRIIVGFCAGAMQPSMVQVLRHWVPPTERNHFMWAYCGITTGTFSTFLLCSVIHYYSRWPVGFYLFGAMQILWSIMWIGLVTDNPQKHPFISKAEKDYLINAISNIFTIKLTNSQAPWKLILKSVPFWAICTLNFGYAWMIIALCLHGPLYYSAILEYSIYSASALIGLPFFFRLVLGTIVIQGFHWYKHQSKMKRIKHIRKYFIVFSHVIPGLLVCICWLTTVVPGPTILTLAVALTAVGMDLTLDLCYELSPVYVNSINTVIKIIGNTPGIIVSFCVGEVTDTYENQPRVWKHIWCFHGLILCLSGVIFLIWGETNIQPWNSLRNSRPRPRRKLLAHPRPSVMSNIVEVEEDDPSNRASSQYHKNRLYVGSFKLSHAKI